MKPSMSSLMESKLDEFGQTFEIETRYLSVEH